jgi:hypothetical protein
MSVDPTRPFDSIESAYEFIVLLEESVEEAVRDVKGHVETASAEHDERRAEALTLALYKMSQLSTHTQKSRRILNDLRTIRRLLFRERGAEG